MSQKDGRGSVQKDFGGLGWDQRINNKEEDDFKYEVEDDLQEHHRYNHDEEKNDRFADETVDSPDQYNCFERHQHQEAGVNKEQDQNRPLHARAGGSRIPRLGQEPHTREQHQQAPPPEREGSSQDVNENFRDVETTGRWGGNLSKMEIIIAGVVVLGVVLGVVLVLVLVVFPENDEEKKIADVIGTYQKGKNNTNLGPFPDVPAKDQLDTILLELKRNKYVEVSSDLSSSVSFYDNYSGDDANVQAMAWLLTDEREASTDDPWLIYRYALANLYFALGGDEWLNNDNWLSKRHACDWYGLSCNLKESLIEIDLSVNNLTGVLPPEFNLLEDVRSLLLSRNNIEGGIPWDALGNMKSLSILYLDDNKLTGDYSEGIVANGILSTMFMQQNNLTGKWPRSLCPLQGQPSNSIFDQLRLDCSPTLRCFCCTQWNCF